MANLNKVVYLSEEQKNTLFTTGSVTANGTTVTYNPNDIYITPPAYDAVPTENSSNLITSGAVYSAISGLSGAMHFKGTTTTAIVDGSTTNPITISGASYTAAAGDVVLREVTTGDVFEYVWTGTAWEMLGRDTSFKVTQSAVNTPNASGNTTAFIDTISQDTNGVITVTKKNLDTNGTWSGTATTATKLNNTSKIGDTNKPVYFTANGVPAAISYEVNKTVPSNAVFTDTTYTFASGDANGQIKVTPSSGTAQNINVTGLGDAAFDDIVPIQHGGTGNADGYIRTGQKNGTTVGTNATIEGEYNEGSGSYSHAEGYKTVAEGSCAHAEGWQTWAKGAYSHAEGQGVKELSIVLTGDQNATTYTATTATDLSQLAVNDYVLINGIRAKITGISMSVSGNTVTGGSLTVNQTCSPNGALPSGCTVFKCGYADGIVSHVEGHVTIASGQFSHAEGYYSKASSNQTHAEGYQTIASAASAHAEGKNTTASNEASHAEGYLTKATGTYSHAEGENTIASGRGSHAEGYYSYAAAQYSHAEGGGGGPLGKFQITNYDQNTKTCSYTCLTTSAGQYVHPEVGTQFFRDDKIPPSGSPFDSFSVIEVNKLTTSTGTFITNNSSISSSNMPETLSLYKLTQASGVYSHVEGNFTQARGFCSHAEGNGTITSSRSQHVFGEYNVYIEENTGSRGTYVEIVGNGTAADTRSNARTLDWDGNETLAGKLTVGTAPTADMDVTTKQYVDNAISTAVPSGSLLTDENVKQTAITASSYGNWRPLIFGSSNNATEDFTPSTVTDQVYTTSIFSVQPSTGTIKATTFKGNASTASKLTNITSSDTAGNTATWRKVWMCYNDNTTGRPAVSDVFAFQTSTGTLKATKFQGDGLTISSLTASQAVSTDTNKNLVSTNLTTSSPTTSGTGIEYIATISQSAVGKITATKSTVRNASTSQTGVLQFTTANTNAQLATLPGWTATPTDDTYLIRRDTAGASSFGQVKFSTVWSYISGKITNGIYWANQKNTSAASYNTTPEIATIKLNGNTSASAASTKNVVLQYDASLEVLNFVFT